jgi:Copper transport outer membrane protein, MctB
VISLRYHVVTIVAIFLALAIGLLGGGAFVQPALQRQLENQTETLRRQRDGFRQDITDLNGEVGQLEAFSDAALAYLTGDRLLGTRVILLTQDGVDGAVLAEAQRALADGGAETVATLTARASIASSDAASQARLAEIIGRPSALAVDLPSLTANALAERLATARIGPGADDDLLAQLLSAGYLTADEGTRVAEIGGAGEVVVVLGGGPSETPVLTPTAFAVPLVGRLVELGMPVAVGESTETPSTVSLVSQTRDGPGDAVVSVDDLDASMGGAQLVLGLADLVRDGTGGAYGFKDGADALPPAP